MSTMAAPEMALLWAHLLFTVHSLVLLQCCILPLCVTPQLNDFALTDNPPLPGEGGKGQHNMAQHS